MVDEIGLLSKEERSELFRLSANTLGIASPVILEKDYWVCWGLAKLFIPGLLDGLVFKGGTSLSKAYRLIRRFSEDVDLTIPFSALGLEALPEDLPRKTRERAIEGARVQCVGVLRGRVRDELLGAAARAGFGEAISVTPDESDPLTLVVQYPTALTDREYGASDYIRQSVRLEFGIRGGVEPAHQLVVEPYCTEAVPSAFGRKEVAVRVLAAERTLWEKATICHANFHRSPTGELPRISRHYSDLAEMASREVAQSALRQPDLLATVVANNRVNFPAAWARYENATPAGIRIVPHEELAAALRRDYSAMSVMFFETPPPFESVISNLQSFEERIRALQTPA